MSFKLEIEMEDNTITVDQNLPGVLSSNKQMHRIRCNESKYDLVGSTAAWSTEPWQTGATVSATRTITRELLEQALAEIQSPTRRR